jgi:hypothetical protein
MSFSWRYAISIPLAAVLLAGASHCAEPLAKEIVVDTTDVACDAFLGFGAEWDSASYDACGVTDDDFARIVQRIRYMRMPIVRVMMQTKWCYRDGAFDWDTPAMRLLYRHLDACQEQGMTVLLTDWGCEPDWLKVPGIAHVADLKYAAAIGGYMDHLINQRGYTCIRYFIMVNEPNYEVRDWARWQSGIENVSAEFERRGLDAKVSIAGSDESNAMDWHQRAVDRTKHLLGAYDVHRYANDSKVRPGLLESFFKEHWDYALAHDPEARSKPFIVGEAGMNDGAYHPSGNQNIGSFYYGLFMADYAVQAARAGSSAVCAWMMDDDGHADFAWGLWGSRKKGLPLRPWFYPWSLLSRYVPRGAVTYRTGKREPDWRLLVARIPAEETGANDEWTVCLVNRGDAVVRTTVRPPATGRRTLQTYLYSPEEAPVDAHGFPVATDKQEVLLEDGFEILCPGGSVVILTTLPW